MTSRFKKIVFLTIIVSFLTPILGKAIVLPNPLEWDTIEDVINGIIDFISWVVVVLTPLMIIIAAFLFITSAGDPEKVKRAKSIIFWTIIGFAVVLLAKGIISMIKQIIGG